MYYISTYESSELLTQYTCSEVSTSKKGTLFVYFLWIFFQSGTLNKNYFRGDSQKCDIKRLLLTLFLSV